jgi:mono/diheme cytochrome c family protein
MILGFDRNGARLAIAGAIFLFIVCCSPVLLSPTAEDEARAKAKYNDITLDQLNKGYNIYLNKCGGCHTLFKPQDYDEAKWLKVLPDMCQRAKLTREQTDLVTKYVLTKRESPVVKRKEKNK